MTTKTSQRQNGFRGGIQTGTIAASVESTKLDFSLKEAAPIVYDGLRGDYPKLTFRKAVKQAAKDEVGAAPDGGVFYYDGKELAVFEAKHQGKGGNAIERWFKNYVFFTRKNPEVSYVTFATGKGVCEGGALIKNFNTHFRQNLGVEATYNVVRPGCSSFYLSEHGFDMSEVQSVMRECIVSSIRTLHEDK